MLKLDRQPALQASSVHPAMHELSFGVQSFLICAASRSWQYLDGLHVGPLSLVASASASLEASPLEDDEELDELLPEPASLLPLEDDDVLLVPLPLSGALATGSGSEPTHAAIAVRARVNDSKILRTLHQLISSRAL